MAPNEPPSLMELTRDKRVLDIGDSGSPFLAETLAAHAGAWYVLGRLPADPSLTLPSHCKVSSARFETQALHLAPSSIDVVLFACPSPTISQDEACLKWTTNDHTLVVLTDPVQRTAYGSPGFWEMARKLRVEAEFQEQGFGCLVLSKAPAAEESMEGPEAQGAETSHRRFPRKGERYHLAPSFHWPNKRPGEKPPVVVIASNWTKTSGHAELVGGGGMLTLRLGDLGTRL